MTSLKKRKACYQRVSDGTFDIYLWAVRRRDMRYDDILSYIQHVRHAL